MFPSVTLIKKFRAFIIKKQNKKGWWFLPPLIFVLAGLYAYWESVHTVYTTNAYVKMDMISITTEVTGRVCKVAVTENQSVKKGDLLFALDPQPFQLVVSNLEAQLQDIQDTIETQKAIYQQKQAEIELAKKDLAYYQQEFSRQQALFQKKTISHAQRDQAQHNVDQAQQRLKIALYSLQGTLASLRGNANIKPQEHPQYLAIKANLDKAKLDLQRTILYAPADGSISRITLVPGDQVSAGAPIFTLFVTNNVWVEANFKETELTYIQPGQKATLWIDSYPDWEWTGYVEGISTAAGSEFALLPPQNATGNWVKVVQRIPVRLRLNPKENQPILRAGMSVSVTIDLSSSQESLKRCPQKP